MDGLAQATRRPVPPSRSARWLCDSGGNGRLSVVQMLVHQCSGGRDIAAQHCTEDRLVLGLHIARAPGGCAPVRNRRLTLFGRGRESLHDDQAHRNPWRAKAGPLVCGASRWRRRVRGNWGGCLGPASGCCGRPSRVARRKRQESAALRPLKPREGKGGYRCEPGRVAPLLSATAELTADHSHPGADSGWRSRQARRACR